MTMWRQAHTGRIPCDHRGWAWSHTAISQGKPETAHKLPKAKKRQRRDPYKLQKEEGSAGTLISDFQPPTLWENVVQLPQATQHVSAWLQQPWPWETNTNCLLTVVLEVSDRPSDLIWKVGYRFQNPKNICAGKDLRITPVFWRQEKHNFTKSLKFLSLKK